MFSSADYDRVRCDFIMAFILQFVLFESALTSLWTLVCILKKFILLPNLYGYLAIRLLIYY